MLEQFTAARVEAEDCARVEAAARYFCGLASAREEALVSRLASSLGPEEQASLVAAHISVEVDACALLPALAGSTFADEAAPGLAPRTETRAGRPFP